MIHVLYGSPPEFQSFLFDVNDHYEGPGVIPDEGKAMKNNNKTLTISML